MDIASYRPAVTTTNPGRPDIVPYREVARTELPSEQRVAAGAEQSAARYASDRGSKEPSDVAERRARIERMADAIREGLERRVDDDKEAGTLVFRTVDTTTGQVVRQFPDDMILKLRAFAREMQRRQDEDGQVGPSSQPGRFVQKLA